MFGGHLNRSRRHRKIAKADTVYDQWRLSIDAYERYVQVSNFTSKFDAFLKRNCTMATGEIAGFQLFNGKGNCNSCHVEHTDLCGMGEAFRPGGVDL